MKSFVRLVFLIGSIGFSARLMAQEPSTAEPEQRNIISCSYQALGSFIAFYHNDAETVTPILGTWMAELSGCYEYRFLDDIGAAIYFDYKDYTWAIGVRGPAVHAGLGLVYHLPGTSSPRISYLGGLEWTGIWASELDFLNGIGCTGAFTAVWKLAPWLNAGIRAAMHMNFTPGADLHVGEHATWADSELYSFSLGPVITVGF
jgi:hypothetical protein